MADVSPGQYNPVVKAKRSGAEVHVSRIIKVESGDVTATEAELPV
jgi:hypothetical protein